VCVRECIYLCMCVAAAAARAREEINTIVGLCASCVYFSGRFFSSPSIKIAVMHTSQSLTEYGDHTHLPMSIFKKTLETIVNIIHGTILMFWLLTHVSFLRQKQLFDDAGERPIKSVTSPCLLAGR
jgi:hypothetical protein